MSLSVINAENCSFKPGWDQLTKKQARLVRSEIRKALGISRSNFYKRLRGEVEPRVSEAIAIQDVFGKFKITKIWGKYEPECETV